MTNSIIQTKQDLLDALGAKTTFPEFNCVRMLRNNVGTYRYPGMYREKASKVPDDTIPENIVSILKYVYLEGVSRLPSVSGVYIVCDRRDRVGYVGEAEDLNKRWKTHERIGFFTLFKDVRVYYLPCFTYIKKEIEAKLVLMLDPLFNGTKVLKVKQKSFKLLSNDEPSKGEMLPYVTRRFELLLTRSDVLRTYESKIDSYMREACKMDHSSTITASFWKHPNLKLESIFAFEDIHSSILGASAWETATGLSRVGLPIGVRSDCCPGKSYPSLKAFHVEQMSKVGLAALQVTPFFIKAKISKNNVPAWICALNMSTWAVSPDGYLFAALRLDCSDIASFLPRGSKAWLICKDMDDLFGDPLGHIAKIVISPLIDRSKELSPHDFAKSITAVKPSPKGFGKSLRSNKSVQR